MKRLADAEADAYSDADDEKDHENLGDNAVSGAELGHKGACPALLLVELGLLLPVLLAGPDLALRLADCGNDPLGACVGGSGGDHGLDVCIERIELVGARRVRVANPGGVEWRRADGGDVGEGSLFGGGHGDGSIQAGATGAVQLLVVGRHCGWFN